MPQRKNNPSHPFVAKPGQGGGRMSVEPLPGDTGPGIVDQTEPAPPPSIGQGRFSDRIRYDEYGGVDKATMRPKQKIQKA